MEAPVKFSKYVIHVLCINFTIFFYYLTKSLQLILDKEE